MYDKNLFKLYLLDSYIRSLLEGGSLKRAATNRITTACKNLTDSMTFIKNFEKTPLAENQETAWNAYLNAIFANSDFSSVSFKVGIRAIVNGLITVLAKIIASLSAQKARHDENWLLL